jgi:hypothetical protein
MTPSCICVVCLGPFEPTRSHAMYCSSSCRQRAYRRRLEGDDPGALAPLARELLAKARAHHEAHGDPFKASVNLVAGREPERFAPLRIAVEARRARLRRERV